MGLEQAQDQQGEELGLARAGRSPHHLQPIPEHALEQYFLWHV
jgi:hypothetical protein